MELDAESKIIKVLAQHSEGIDDRLLAASLKDVDNETRVNVLNKLIENK